MRLPVAWTKVMAGGSSSVPGYQRKRYRPFRSPTTGTLCRVHRFFLITVLSYELRFCITYPTPGGLIWISALCLLPPRSFSKPELPRVGYPVAVPLHGLPRPGTWYHQPHCQLMSLRGRRAERVRLRSGHLRTVSKRVYPPEDGTKAVASVNERVFVLLPAR